MEKKVQGREDERSAFTVGVVVWGVDASWPRAYVYARTVSERPRNPNPNPKPVSAPWVNETVFDAVSHRSSAPREPPLSLAGVQRVAFDELYEGSADLSSRGLRYSETQVTTFASCVVW